MGLSERERIASIYHNAHYILVENRLIKETKHFDEHYKVLISLCDEIWPAILGNTSNGIHWITGSASVNLVTRDNLDLWSIAITDQIPTVQYGKVVSERRPLKEDSENFFKPPIEVEDFLIRVGFDAGLRHVVKIFRYTENLVYSLRRYNDEFLENLQSFSDLICKIQGTCFSILRQNEIFLKAYVASEIASILYASNGFIFKSSMDIVTKWLVDQNLHHDINRVMDYSEASIAWLIEQHVALLSCKENEAEAKRTRIIVALRMAGRKYYYDHNFKELLDLIKHDTDLSSPEFLTQLQAEFAACKQAKVDYDKNYDKKYKDSHKPEALYGYFDVLKKETQHTERETNESSKGKARRTIRKVKNKSKKS